MGVPHEVKGESIYAFVTLMDGLEMTPALQKELKQVAGARSRLPFPCASAGCWRALGHSLPPQPKSHC